MSYTVIHQCFASLIQNRSVFTVLSEWFIYNHGDTVGYKIKKITVGYRCGQPWLCLAAVRSVFVGHTVKCVLVYIRCMRATIVYIYLCDCTAISECEAHLIIVPASVCVWGGSYKVMEGFTCFAVRRVVMVGFWGGDRW